MRTWPTMKLGELTSLISSGATPLGGATTYLDHGPVIFLRSQNVQMRHLSLSGVAYIDDEADNAIRRTRVNFGDVLLNITGASIGRVSTFDLQGVRANVNQHVCVIRPIENLLYAQYLTHFLASNKFQSEIDRVQSGGTRQALTFSKIAGFDIPLPPLPEQQRIVAILDKADSIRRKRQEAVWLTEELLRSVFLDMFGDPVENAKKWPLMPIGTAIRSIETGWSANSEDYPRENDEWAVLKISSVTSGCFLPGECKVVDEGQIDRELLTPRRGDLLFSRANTRELVAATCLVEQNEPKLFLPDKLWKIIPDEKITCTEYLRYLLAHPRFREKLTKQATGTSGSMLNISQAKVRGIEMPVPPIKLQKQFATLVWRNYNIRNKLEAASQLTNTLFNSLLQQTFKEKY